MDVREEGEDAHIDLFPSESSSQCALSAVKTIGAVFPGLVLPIADGWASSSARTTLQSGAALAKLINFAPRTRSRSFSRQSLRSLPAPSVLGRHPSRSVCPDTATRYGSRQSGEEMTKSAEERLQATGIL